MNAQEYRSLQEAYLSVYSQDIAESECEDDDDESDEKMSKMNGKKKGKKEKEEEKEEESEEEMNEDYDFFDIILEYLVAEGYADTNQAALAIMANMSEEWKRSIIED